MKSIWTRQTPSLTQRYARQMATETSSLPKWTPKHAISPLFLDKFANDELDKKTIYVIQEHGAAKIKMAGVHSERAFLELTGGFGSKLDAARPSVSELSGAEKAYAVYIPSKCGVFGQDSVEIYCDAAQVSALKVKLAALGRNFAPATLGQLVQRNFSNGQIALGSFPEMAEILSSNSEVERRRQLRSSGAGLCGLYKAWNEEIVHCQNLLNGNFRNEASRVYSHNLVKQKLAKFQSFLTQHVQDERRAALMKKGCQVTLLGPPNSGKSTLMNLIAQKSVCAVDEKSGSTRDVFEQIVRVQGVPLVLADTVGVSGTDSLDLKHGIYNTFSKIDSADLKICVLDMETLYQNKTANAINQSVLESIDADTIVLVNKRDLVDIRVPAAPGKLRYKNAPLSPQGDVNRTMFRGRVPLRLDGDTTGNTVLYGDYGLKVLEDVRLTEACLNECRATLHRNVKKVRGGRFWLRVKPDHPMTSKALGTRMGKGKAAFDHWEAKVPNKKIIFEIGGGVREELARTILKCVGSRVPGQTEFVVAPKEETVDELCARVKDYSKVAPLGVWCISCKTGEGIYDFLSELSTILKKRYNVDGEQVLSTPETQRMQVLDQCQSLLAQMESAQHLTAESTAKLGQTLSQIVDKDAAELASRYLYHSKYGVLNMKQMQLTPPPSQNL